MLYWKGIVEMKQVGEYLLTIHEKQAFGVFTWVSSKLNIKSSSVRVAFIYLSFITFGSPIFLYLIAAFILKHKEYFKPVRKTRTIWEL
jgi:phage shock protein PspC (stress-responsive transcriptional regulator)